MLIGTSLYKLFNSMIYLFFVLTCIWQFKKFFLFCPLTSLGCNVWCFIINCLVFGSSSTNASSWIVVLICIWNCFWLVAYNGATIDWWIRFDIIFSKSSCNNRSFNILHRFRFFIGSSSTPVWALLIINIKICCVFFLISLPFLLFNQLLNQFLLINWFFNLVSILITFLLHHKHRLMISILNKFIFDVLVHHVESIFNIIFCPSWHFFYYFGPFVANA